MKLAKAAKIILVSLLFLSLQPVLSFAGLSDGLVAYYPFDGNAEDATSFHNNGVAYGGLTYKQGIQGASASFDGVDSYIRIPSSDSLNPRDQLSISFWIKIDDYTNIWSPLLHKGGTIAPGFSNREYSIWVKNPSQFYLSSAGNDSSPINSLAYGAMLGRWVQYIGVIDRQNGKMKMYVDGKLVLDIDDQYSTFNNNDNDLTIGWTEEVGPKISPFKGRIDELRIYDRILSNEEISILSQNASPTLTGCDNSNSCTLENLFDGNSFQVDGVLMTNWELVNATTNVDLSNIEIGPGYGGPGEIGIWPKTYEYLYVNQGAAYGPVKSLELTFDFMVTSTEDQIVEVDGTGGYCQVSGYYYDTPWINKTIAIGTSKGGDDIGSTSQFLSLNNKTQPTPIEIPEGINQFWIRSTISLNSSHHGYAAAGFYPSSGHALYPAFRILYNKEPATPPQEMIGGLIEIPSNNSFLVEKQSPQNFSVQVSNKSESIHSASVEIINPYDGISLTSDKGDITLNPEESIEITLNIEAEEIPAGVYDGFLMKLMVENGDTLFSNITVTVVEPGGANVPDLSINSSDIVLTDYTLGDEGSSSIEAKVYNNGLLDATNVKVQFYEFGNLLKEETISEIPAKSFRTLSVTVPITTSGEHLVQVILDPFNETDEFNENNNEASQIIKLGADPALSGNILVTGSMPSTLSPNEIVNISGKASYDVYVDGERYTNYALKGGSVQLTIHDANGYNSLYGGIYTNTDGKFSKTILAPELTGEYYITMIVTDGTFVGKREILFSVTEPSPEPPLPIPSHGEGQWIWIPDGSSPDSAGKWVWDWTSPPVNAPNPETDISIYSDGIHFSKLTPGPDDELTIFAKVNYWATSTDVEALEVPLNFYATYPGASRMKIGETVINKISAGEPDFGSRYAYISWKNRGEGIYIIEVELDPSFVDDNLLNNAATRAIIVGSPGSYTGAMAGQVTSQWGCIEDVEIEVLDQYGGFVDSEKTDKNGYFLFKNLAVAEYQVHIIPPEGHIVNPETKSVEVVDQSVAEVDFDLVRDNPPTANPGENVYLGAISVPITFDGSASSDPEGSPLSYEWSFGDGSTGTGVTTNHVYDEAGLYDVCLMVNDDYLSDEACTTAIVYDPAAGFVTGGGWINSPPNSFPDNPSLSGKASFAFISKYQKGNNIPTGKTEFQFYTADLYFYSDSYDYLVVTQGGTNAQFKGEGLINDVFDQEGNPYKFMIWATDNDPADTFRIKIWSEDSLGNEMVIYDNGFNQVIGAGNIVVHVKDK